eukprot:TRINITY_DN596_c0_g1_i1.p1 TRINITY_DN596_c0_g1~~TRINITY_DN596_c0_g1_i1.p1  ORF type:complete len:570 (+),score=128.39 TRINITY_DN596_c0_g1_i1:42-1751(+)
MLFNSRCALTGLSALVLFAAFALLFLRYDKLEQRWLNLRREYIGLIDQLNAISRDQRHLNATLYDSSTFPALSSDVKNRLSWCERISTALTNKTGSTPTPLSPLSPINNQTVTPSNSSSPLSPTSCAENFGGVNCEDFVGPLPSYTFWSSDHHIGPIGDQKYILKRLGQQVIDKSLSGHCHIPNTCATDLRVFGRDNLPLTIEFLPCAINIRRAFFESYKNDPLMKSVDAFLCSHPSAMCEAFMPFNRSLIVVATTRFEIGRWGAARWQNWITNLRRMAANPLHVIAANNAYDQHYVQYFAGVKCDLIPNLSDFIGVQYNPTQPQILLSSKWDYAPFWNTVKSLANKVDGQYKAGINNATHIVLGDEAFQVVKVRDLYPQYQYSDLVAHRALIYMPYQVSVMSLFEAYRMNIPLFFPSRKLLTDLQLKYHVLSERTWDDVFGHPSSHSAIGQHPDNAGRYPYDPNDEFSYDAIYYWLQYSDFYVWPYITLYDSPEHLVQLLRTVNLREINIKQTEYNEKYKVELMQQWKNIIYRLFKLSPPGSRQMPDNFERAMKDLWNVDIRPGVCDQ